MEPIIVKIALPLPVYRLFDYLIPQGIDVKAIKPRLRVKVPFQSRTLVGVIVGIERASSIPIAKLKAIIEIIDEHPLLPDDVYQLCHFAADYYQGALGEVFAAAFPSLLRKAQPVSSQERKKRKEIAEEEAGDLIKDQPNSTPYQLNAAQQQAVTAISALHQQFKVFLLDGITGSGKTEVYLQVMANKLSEGKQILVLVPEISLTPQTIERFRKRFSVPIFALHSGLSAKERLSGWFAAKEGRAKIIIGTRSAIFTPFAALSLIIVDEEHDTSFKQQDRFRYHARDLAIFRAQLNQIPILLGSATPSLETLLNVKRARYDYLSLPMRAGGARLPQYQIIDLRSSKTKEGFSSQLLHAIRDHLSENNQVLLFLNRRGFAPVWYCRQCAYFIDCKRCDSKMVYHRSPQNLQCHHCDAQVPLLKDCPNCGQSFQAVGVGTERLHHALSHHFPDVPIIRLDRDNTRHKGQMNQLLQQIQTEPKAILLGTQMLAKGHHFPRVTLVGIVDGDSGLFSADFRATEQMGQLLVQVAGRAGRAEKAGTVLIQTYHPEHPLLQTLMHQGYAAFSSNLLIEREEAHLPPFTYFAVLRAEAQKIEHASQFLATIKLLVTDLDERVSLLGPVPAMLARRKGYYCHHLLFKTNTRRTLQTFLKNLLQKMEDKKMLGIMKRVKWILDVDPVGM